MACFVVLADFLIVLPLGVHHFETLQEFETGDFLLQFKSCLHGIFYLDKHTICKQ